MKYVSILTLFAFLVLRATAAPTDPPATDPPATDPPAEGEVYRCKPSTHRNLHNSGLLTLRALQVQMRIGCAHYYSLSRIDELILSNVCRIYARLDTLAADPCIPRKVECK